MKKTLYLLCAALVAASAMQPASATWYNVMAGGISSDNNNLLATDASDNYLNLKDGYYNTLTTTTTPVTRFTSTDQQTDNNLGLRANGANKSIDISILEAVYFNKVESPSDALVNHVGLDFGSEGQLNCASSLNFGGGVKTANVGSITLSAAVSTANVERVLISAVGNYGAIYNFSDAATLSVTLNGAEGTYRGFVNSIDDLSDGQYGLIFTGKGSSSTTSAPHTVTLVGKNLTLVPEPATATLSLLALAGLAARRRRH